MYVFYFFACVSIWVGVQSLRGGIRYLRYVRSEAAKPLAKFTPFASVIAPTRGLDDGLIENIRPLLLQEYPDYEVLFVCDRDDDPALNAIRTLLARESRSEGPAVRIVIAGAASDSGQKVHNLRVAVQEVDRRSEVFVFVDTDARPGTTWLRQLVSPLSDPGIAASSGYRWFVPVRGGLSSRLRSIWNASVASALGSNRQRNFCWGGSTAIRRETFRSLNVSERWRGSVSDDFTLTRVIQESKLPIHFTPNCLVPSLGDCDFRELVEFSTRQIKITRVYATHLWHQIMLGGVLFTAVFFGGLILLAIQIWRGRQFLILLGMLLAVFLLGAAKSLLRWRAVRIVLGGYRNELMRDVAGQMLLWPFASLLYLYNALAAALSRRIEWRGITYELKSPIEAVIISRDS